jgi:hypothetical protein
MISNFSYKIHENKVENETKQFFFNLIKWHLPNESLNESQTNTFARHILWKVSFLFNTVFASSTALQTESVWLECNNVNIKLYQLTSRELVSTTPLIPPFEYANQQSIFICFRKKNIVKINKKLVQKKVQLTVQSCRLTDYSVYCVGIKIVTQLSLIECPHKLIHKIILSRWRGANPALTFPQTALNFN